MIEGFANISPILRIYLEKDVFCTCFSSNPWIKAMLKIIKEYKVHTKNDRISLKTIARP